jgi:IS5 family transposase
MDATACPQDIAYPTDLNLANQAREKLEELVERLYVKHLHGKKPRAYRVIARADYLGCAQKKGKTRQQVGNAVRKQLRYIKRDIEHVHGLLDAYDAKGLPFPLKPREQKYFFVVQSLYEQQMAMYVLGAKSVEHRIVSIHQPHIRPIVRGKEHRPVEFGAKINVSLVNGIAFLDDLSWEAFNEGSRLVAYVERYRERFGFYPCQVLADQIYCTKANRKEMSLLGVKLVGKPLGKNASDPALSIHVSPGERNPIEGKFGQGKTGCGLDRILARLQRTSESWIAAIFLVLNLVSLAGAALRLPGGFFSEGAKGRMVPYLQFHQKKHLCYLF